MYSVNTRENIDKIFKKLSRKNPKIMHIIRNKIKQILENPYRFKPLKVPMQNKRRVHIEKSFVLIYSIDENSRTVILEDYDHHDNIYK